MSDFYDELRSDLLPELVTEFLRPATLSKETRAYDPDLDETTTTKVETPCRAIIGVETYRTPEGARVSRTVAKVNVEPKHGDRLTLGSKTFSVEQVEERNPDGKGAMIWIAEVKS